MATREQRFASRRRKAWSAPPLRIDRAECITCDDCVRACPPRLDAIIHHAGSLVVIPELCSGCGACLPVCPVDCIHPDPDWQPAPDSWWRSALRDAESERGSARAAR
jgi:electron transport complex protein RnfB